MTEPAAVGYLGVAAMVAAVCALVFLAAAVMSALIDRHTAERDETQP
ncbi:hypothetical protein [Streptomyces sp. NBC_00582]|nr:hypothetical protein [Streptomyces sp. NBC_00582]WUB64639.1 hypothetical protein OG852_31675 [Streptomyces sp. NBC_00582]